MSKPLDDLQSTNEEKDTKSNDRLPSPKAKVHEDGNPSSTDSQPRSASKFEAWVEIDVDTDGNRTVTKLRDLVKVIKKSRFLEKIIFVIAVITIIFLTHAVIYGQWLLPFYYTICTPILIILRIIMYWKNKWQFFLIDFCYFGNILWFVFIWISDVKIYFDIVFALANGPLLWAMVVYRNSLVFHSLDKVTSTYIHILPPILSFGIRWYPVNTSLFWYKDFVQTFEFSALSVIWLLVLPLCCFIFHSIMYFCIIQVIVKPSEEYATSFGYLGKKESSFLFKVFNVCGSRWRTFSFYFFNALFCLLTLFGVLLVYNFYIAHCVLLSIGFLVVLYNGGCYYMDVFSSRGFVDE